MRKFIKKSVVAIMTAAMVISSVGTVGTKVEASSGYELQNYSVQDLMLKFGVIAFDNLQVSSHCHSNFMVNKLNMTETAGLRQSYNQAEEFYFTSAVTLREHMTDEDNIMTDTLYTAAAVEMRDENGNNVPYVALSNGTSYQKISNPKVVIHKENYVNLQDVQKKFMAYNYTLSKQTETNSVVRDLTSTENMNNRYVKVLGTGLNCCNIPYEEFIAHDTYINFYFTDFDNDDVLVVNVDLANAKDTNGNKLDTVSFKDLVVCDGTNKINSAESNFGTRCNRMYFNFYDSSNASGNYQYTGKIKFNAAGFGTIIAPSATVEFGHNWDGTVIAKNIVIGGEYHRVDGTKIPEVTLMELPNTGTDTPGGNTPGSDTPGGNTPGNDTPGNDTPSGDTPSGDTPSGDTPSGDTPSGDTPSGDTPSGDTPSGDTPSGDTPSGDTPSGDTPSGDTPSGDTPSGDTPSGDTPSSDTPSGDTPSGDTPSGDTPSSDTPSGDTPNNDNKNDSKDKSSVSITIKDETTDDPVPGAKVEVTNPDGTKTEYVTDENGEITLEDVPEGDYKVVVKDVPKGYDVTIGTEVKVRVKKGDNKQNIVTNTGNKSMKAKNTQDAKNAKKALKGAADVKTGDDTVVSATLKQNSEITQVGAKNNKTVTKTYNKQLKSFKKKHKKQSKEIAAWITIAGTKIDYPVMYSGLKNNTKYLKKDINGKKDSHGMLFASYITPTRKITYNNVIYGHNMKDGTMFTDLLKYQNKSFYKNHKYVKLSTKGYNYSYEVVEVIRISCKKGSKDRMILEKFAEIGNKKVFNQWKKQVTKNREYKCSGKYNRNDTLMILSTCEYEKENGRFVLVCKQVKNKKVK